jgi:Ser/Thr protein kinase RdoA (MazF antagonist)
MDLTALVEVWPVLGRHAQRVGGTGGAIHLRGGDGDYFLKRRPSAQHALREASVLRQLRERGLPVPEHVRTQQGEPFAVLGAGAEVSCLYRALPGSHYDSFHGKPGLRHARQLGAALGRLHTALAELPMVGFERYGREAHVVGELATASTPYDVPRLERIAARRSPSAALPQQLIHRDFHLYNVLFAGDRASGYLDFDMLMSGPRLFDVCYCSIETLAKRFDEPGFPEYWFAVLGAIIKGYSEHVALTALERRSIPSLMTEIELLLLHHFRTEPVPGKNAERVLHWLDERRALIRAVIDCA